MTRIFRFGLLLLATAALAAPPAPTGDEEVATRLRLAAEAERAGDADRARAYRLAALSLEPRSTRIMGLLAVAEGKDAETAALWAHVAATRWGTGKLVLAGDWPGLESKDLANARDVVKRRGRALKAVLSALRRQSGAGKGAVVAHLASLGRALRPATPEQHASLEDAAATANARCRVDPEVVVRALRDLASSAFAAGDDAVAVAAARILLGLARQKAWLPDAPGDRGAFGSKTPLDVGDAGSILAKVRARMRAQEPTVHSVKTLSAMSREEAVAFSETHAAWGAPGVAISPEGLYRVETVCGHGTLLVATRLVEGQHRRVARWFGQDPFEGRPGTVRLCRSPADFERAGQPFWWASGFQGGDLTGIIVNFGEGNGLARTITHELTHRFDGALNPGLMGWLLEGRAVHVETCTPNVDSPEVDERLFSGGRIARAHELRYGRPDKLEALLRGKLTDYRDNYDAGYALWQFLSRFPGFEESEAGGPPAYAPRLPGYMKSLAARNRPDHVKAFVAAFADGKDGRPKGLDEFAARFERFLEEYVRTEPPAWCVVWHGLAAKARRARGRSPARPIFDRRAWPRHRRRYEPPEYGEGQAGPAGVLLAAAGRDAAAREAFAWAREIDEPVGTWLALAADLHEKVGQKGVAWTYRGAAARADPGHHGHPGPAPSGSPGTAHRTVAALADFHADLAEKAEKASRTRLAFVHRADHDRLAEALGAPPRPGAETPSGHAGAPDCVPYRTLLEGGLVGDRWSPTKCGPNGPWHSPGPGRVVLGRRKPGPVQSGRIRDAGIRRVFIRDREHHDGTWSVRVRIRLLTSVFESFLVLGRTRHDRGMMLRFSGGDSKHRHGRRRDALPLEGVRVVLSDLRPYDPTSALLSEAARVDPPRDEFEVEVHVSGPLVLVLVDGRTILVHRRTTGDPVEGHIGFGLVRGLVVLEDPEIRHHRVVGDGRICPCRRFDEAVRFDRPMAFSLSDAIGRRVVGLPENPGGTLLLWCARDRALGDDAASAARREVEYARKQFTRLDLPIEIAVALPPVAGRDLPAAAEVGVAGDRVRAHAGHSDVPWGRKWAWLLIDDRGVVRFANSGFLEKPAFDFVRRLVGW